MKIISINLPMVYINAIQTLNDSGKYQSRSEAVRTALRDFLINELQMYEDLETKNLKKLLRGIK